MKIIASAKQKKKPKYHNVKTVVDGVTFDSKRESLRYRYLKMLERAGEISELRLQVKFELIPSQRINSRVVERSVDYVADFTYNTKSGVFVCEDSKGCKTKDYILKRKMMLFFHGIQVIEV